MRSVLILNHCRLCVGYSDLVLVVIVAELMGDVRGVCEKRFSWRWLIMGVSSADCSCGTLISGSVLIQNPDFGNWLKQG
ncbi:hypothetical protein [Gimesia fumaroli]|uniref:hypothetical protein n=1 Tax=Gimesia fumaroli TaxID=2527976 RepID=UPI00119F05D6|nr:hypothetical protein [Gimesia fumaroli]